MSSEGQALAPLLRRQALDCRRSGSPLYGELLERLATDTEAGGPGLPLLEGRELDPPGSALALRLMGAVHRLVLSGSLTEVAAHYPSAGGDGDADACWPAFQRALSDHAEQLRGLITQPVQTNEVGRSAALIGGFLQIAAVTALPLRVLELGASAGLNLRFDRYFYATAHSSWGQEDSPVRFEGLYEGDPLVSQPLELLGRAGCDTHALDPGDPEDALTLRCYVWPDQTRRLERLERALEIARSLPVAVQRAGALEWATRELSGTRPGATTVVFHSIFAQYLSNEERKGLLELLQEVGERSNEDAPLAWLRMEPEPIGGAHAEVRLRIWPQLTDRLLARSGFHGEKISWL